MGLGFAGVGALMLVLVLFTYLRMINGRAAVRERRSSKGRLVIEQADTLVAFGREQDAIRLLEKALEKEPDSTAIQATLKRIKLELEEREQDDDH
ncbi:hypothetical protein BGP77_14790 [Saccharospirillum sp. MSK14-1]|uniref:type IV pilus assembly protein FimV n=1 Tax=Saccharospirillum sp. MSK14-1 TaxID=1897632 RepID=UPI000D38429E|nr:tetratricopeptide repeat protein [Saccharospirillum sp. MSK14-1]PTY37746.1 hypothetical protein BGP77_14790 [Saccharospirillum sp. MSK14-1]